MPIKIVDVTGDAYARGRTYGTKCKKEIAACMDAWKRSLVMGGVADPDGYIVQMVRETNFTTAIRQHAPDILEELRGIAAGSEQDFNALYILNCLDEEKPFRMDVLARAAPTDRCSTIGIRSPDGTIRAGQNVDMSDFADGHQLALRAAPNGSEPGFLIFTVAGVLVLIGINSFGVGVFVNTLPQLPYAREGLPVAFVLRKLLQAKSASEAAKTVQVLPHASGQHYLIADPSSIRSFETSAAGVMEYHSPDPSRILHTNHVLADETWNAAYGRDQTGTNRRLDCLTKRLMTGNPDLASIKATLISADDPKYPVCMQASGPNATRSMITGMIAFTAVSMIVELRQGSREIDIWASAGPPIGGYEHIRFERTP